MAEDNASPSPPDPVPPALSRRQRREEAVRDALRALLRDTVLEHFGRLPEDAPPLPLTLHLAADPSAQWQVEFTPPLAEQILDQGADYAAARAAYCPGRVYCYRCRSARCEHAAPPDPLAVFRGYEANGLPGWQELTQSFLDAGDSRVDQLFEKPPRVVARVVAGKALKQQQLSTYGRQSRTYVVLGQVVAGYVPLRPASRGRRNGTPPERLAITWQAVESRDGNGDIMLRLNPLAGIPGGGTLEELFAAEWESWVEAPPARAARALASLEESVRTARQQGDPAAIRKWMGRVPGVLRELAQSIERGHRQTRRRTKHAEQRREEQRPVHMAWQDLRQAGPGDFLQDERSDTVILSARQGRTHVFSREARHVTSFVCTPQAREQRIRRGRWAALPEARRDEFLAQTSS